MPLSIGPHLECDRCSSPAALAGQSLWNVSAACSPSLRTPVSPSGPSLLANALVLIVTLGLLASAFMLVKRFLEHRQARSDRQARRFSDKILYSTVHSAETPNLY